MKKTFLSMLLGMAALCATAKSIVFTLNDKVGTRVYFRIDAETAPKLVMKGDGTFTMNGMEFEFSNVKYFEYSKEDYSGEKNTIDAIDEVSEAPRMSLSGNVLMLDKTAKSIKIYTTDGKLVKNETNTQQVNLSQLPAGAYVISNGVSTLKIQKR